MAPEDIRERIAQVARWLRYTFPPDYPVRVYWSTERAMRSYDRKLRVWYSLDASIYMNETMFAVRLHPGLLLREGPSDAIHSLIHEWAHALSWEEFTAEDGREHGPKWWAKHGQVYERYFDRDGHAESRDF